LKIDYRLLKINFSLTIVSLYQSDGWLLEHTGLLWGLMQQSGGVVERQAYKHWTSRLNRLPLHAANGNFWQLIVYSPGRWNSATLLIDPLWLAHLYPNRWPRRPISLLIPPVKQICHGNIQSAAEYGGGRKRVAC